MTTCKNCNYRFEGNFCNHCGQSAATHRLTMHFILHDLQHGLFHVDRGIFYTIGQLLTRPGRMIREFIDGKRTRYFKPVALVVVLATLYGLFYHYLITNPVDTEPESVIRQRNVLDTYEKVAGWLTHHFAYATLLLIVDTTIASYLVFKKQGDNFAEHLVLNTFYRALVLIVSLLFLPILYHYHDTKHAANYVLVAQFTDFALMYFCYWQFFSKLPAFQSLGLTLLAFLITSGMNVGIAYLLGWIVL